MARSMSSSSWASNRTGSAPRNRIASACSAIRSARRSSWLTERTGTPQAPPITLSIRPLTLAIAAARLGIRPACEISSTAGVVMSPRMDSCASCRIAHGPSSGGQSRSTRTEWVATGQGSGERPENRFNFASDSASASAVTSAGWISSRLTVRPPCTQKGMVMQHPRQG